MILNKTQGFTKDNTKSYNEKLSNSWKFLVAQQKFQKWCKYNK